MTETIVISIILLALAMAGLCVKLLVRRDGRFSSMHIHDSEAMKQRGIHCVMDQDREAREAGCRRDAMYRVRINAQQLCAEALASS